MGTATSKSIDHDVPKLQLPPEAGIVHAGLKRHRKDIENMTHTVKSQHAHVQLLLQDISQLERITEATSSDHFKAFTSKWKTNTKELLSSIQSSLECQCESLLMSYKTINTSIFDIFKNYTIDAGSSDDTNVDLCVFEYDKDIQNSYGLRKTTESEVDKLEKKVQLLTEELETNKLSMKDNIDKLKTDKEVLERLVKDLKEHRPVSIQLYYQVKGDMTSKMLDALKSMLVTQMGVERNELQFIVCQNELDVNPELPLLVFCISASRLGTDVSTVLQKLNVSSKVSVLIFHHKDIHALPNQSSERVLTGPEFKALGGIFDIAFLSDKGIYPCDMNQTAAVGIESFLRTQS